MLKQVLCNDINKDFKAPKKISPVPDGIPPLLAKEITYPLSKIFQTSLNSGRLPEDWLTANVSLIYKGGQLVDSKISGEPYNLRLLQ